MSDSKASQPETVAQGLIHPEIGDYVDIQYLLAMGGQFYPMDGKSYCDTPLMSFVLEPESFTQGYRRIE
jgi:hypothetical protein